MSSLIVLYWGGILIFRVNIFYNSRNGNGKDDKETKQYFFSQILTWIFFLLQLIFDMKLLKYISFFLFKYVILCI